MGTMSDKSYDRVPGASKGSHHQVVRKELLKEDKAQEEKPHWPVSGGWFFSLFFILLVIGWIGRVNPPKEKNIQNI